MKPGCETSTEQHCLNGDPQLPISPLALGEKDSAASSWDPPAATRVPTSDQPWPQSHIAWKNE